MYSSTVLYDNGLVAVILELLTALLEYLDFNGIVQSAAVKASLLLQNASIIPDSYTCLLCSKLCWHDRLIPNLCVSVIYIRLCIAFIACMQSTFMLMWVWNDKQIYIHTYIRTCTQFL